MLGDIHFLSKFQSEDVHLGYDFLFWYYLSQSLKQIFYKDQFIPVLIREEKESTTHFYQTWKVMSSAYQQLLEQSVNCMPLVCSQSYQAKTLLRHFSEVIINQILQESFTEAGRLARGKAYGKDSRVIHWHLKDGIIQAKIRGNINPYFGVYEEPTYRVELKMTPLPLEKWLHIVTELTQKVSFIGNLLVDELPENIEQVFAKFDSHLLPQDYHDFQVSCSCPDYAVPCKHIAGVCNRLATIIDNEPLILFEMRGITIKRLHQELIKSPLGKILSEAQAKDVKPSLPVTSYYTQPLPSDIPHEVQLKDFWNGKHPLPTQLPEFQESLVPAVSIKKGGDYPAFWHKQSSFIATMEDFIFVCGKSIINSYKRK